MCIGSSGICGDSKDRCFNSLFYAQNSTYNLTVYDYGTLDVFSYFWSEFIASSGANEVASCVHNYNYLKVMQNARKEKVTLISDKRLSRSESEQILLNNAMVFSFNTEGQIF